MKRRRIDLLAPPFSGHLNPFLAMARLLNEKYDVRVLSTEAAQDAIKHAGIKGAVILPGCDNRLSKIVNPSYAVGSNPVRLHRQFSAALNMLLQLKIELSSLYSDDRPDLLIADFTLATVGTAADEMNIPWWTSMPSPCVLETPDGTPAYLGGWKPPVTALERLRDYAGRICIRSFKKIIAWLYRRTIAKSGLTNIYRKDGAEAIYSKECILLLGMREIEFERTWPKSASFMGPLLYTPADSAIAPPFVDGRKHLLVTMGTHLNWVKDHIAAELKILAQRMPHIEIHFTDGNIQCGKIETTGNFKRLPFINYEEHLHKYDLVLHHGGSGVMYYCIKAGVKSLVYPVDYDQFDNAARIEQAGLSHWVHSLDDLESLVSKALNDMEMAHKCQEYARLFESLSPEKQFLEKVGAFFDGHPM